MYNTAMKSFIDLNILILSVFYEFKIISSGIFFIDIVLCLEVEYHSSSIQVEHAAEEVSMDHRDYTRNWCFACCRWCNIGDMFRRYISSNISASKCINIVFRNNNKIKCTKFFIPTILIIYSNCVTNILYVSINKLIHVQVYLRV